MKTSEDLRRAIRAIDRKGYPALKSLAGGYDFGAFSLFVDHVQGDPFAAPSTLRVEVPHAQAGFPARLRKSACDRRALADHLARAFAAQLARASFKANGSGKSGLLAGARCGQEVLERSACEVGEHGITARFEAGLPAFGRTVNGEGLARMLLELVPQCVSRALFFRALDAAEVERAVFLAEDQEALRRAAREAGLAAFVADGAVLPRESGVSERPLEGAVPFASPETLRCAFDLPHAGRVSGMGIPRGVTLIVGGGYHGKSTLLEALQAGVYDHVAGDGREFVVTDETAVKLRAEDGRAIRTVDISPFITNLPSGADTTAFSTENASGSTSQAAAVMEGLEACARVFLVDEDTSAANFMVRDELMQQVVSREHEPITPFVERVRALYERAGASTILVAGSSGAFFAVADLVIQMDAYRAFDITDRVRAVCAKRETAGACGAREAAALENMSARVMLQATAANEEGRKRERPGGSRGRGRGGVRGSGPERMKVRSHGRDTVSLGKTDIDVRYVEQIVDDGQTAALAYFCRYALENLADGARTLPEIAQELSCVFDARGWAPFSGSYVPSGLARPRPQELLACLNRYRGTR